MTDALYPQLSCRKCEAVREHRFLGTERGTGSTAYECTTCHSMQSVKGDVMAPVQAPLLVSGPQPNCLNCATRDARIAELESRLRDVEGVAGGWLRAVHRAHHGTIESAPSNGAVVPEPGVVADVIPLHPEAGRLP